MKVSHCFKPYLWSIATIIFAWLYFEVNTPCPLLCLYASIALENHHVFGCILDNNRCNEERLCETIADHVRNVKRVRAFGLLLKIETRSLNEFEKDLKTAAGEIVREWFRIFSMNATERWEELERVLLALGERKLAKEVKPHVRCGSSIDSAISTPTSPISSSTEVSIENIGQKSEDCTMDSVLEAILPYSKWWHDLGKHLDLPHKDLDEILKKSDPVPHLVELWDRWDTDGISWEKLYQALNKIVSRRESGASIMSQAKPGTPEPQPAQDLSVWMKEEPVAGKIFI